MQNVTSIDNNVLLLSIYLLSMTTEVKYEVSYLCHLNNVKLDY